MNVPEGSSPWNGSPCGVPVGVTGSAAGSAPLRLRSPQLMLDGAIDPLSAVRRSAPLLTGREAGAEIFGAPGNAATPLAGDFAEAGALVGAIFGAPGSEARMLAVDTDAAGAGVAAPTFGAPGKSASAISPYWKPVLVVEGLIALAASAFTEAWKTGSLAYWER